MRPARTLRPMAHLKKDAPPDVIETLRQAEAQADECWRGLQIRYNPSNVAIWALLTGGIKAVEREQAARGSNTSHFDPMLANLSRSLAVAVKWAIRHGQPVTAPLLCSPRRYCGSQRRVASAIGRSAHTRKACARAKDDSPGNAPHSSRRVPVSMKHPNECCLQTSARSFA